MIVRMLLVVCLMPRIAVAEDQTTPAAPFAPKLEFSLKLGNSGKSPAPRADGEKSSKGAGRFRFSFDLNVSFQLSIGLDESTNSSKPNTADDGKLSELERELIDLTNKEREKLKLPPLKADPVLMKLAREQNAHMVRLNQLGHELEGETFSKRLKESGYTAMAAGENCAEGAASPKEAVADWMTSEFHKSNILSDKYTHLGVAQGKSQEGKTYSTQVFAKPFEAQKPMISDP